MARRKSHLASGKPTNSPFQSHRNTLQTVDTTSLDTSETATRTIPRATCGRSNLFSCISLAISAAAFFLTTELYDARVDLFALSCQWIDALFSRLRQDLHWRQNLRFEAAKQLGIRTIWACPQNVPDRVRSSISKRARTKATFRKLMSGSSVQGVTYRRQRNANLRSMNDCSQLNHCRATRAKNGWRNCETHDNDRESVYLCFVACLGRVWLQFCYNCGCGPLLVYRGRGV